MWRAARPAALPCCWKARKKWAPPTWCASSKPTPTKLKADAAVISDTGMWDVDTPAISTRLRGIVYTEITLHAANRDLHSGMYGGSALNPD